MKRLTVAAVSLILATAAISNSALAAPRVSGSTISWPDLVAPVETGTDNGMPAGQIPIPANARLDEAAPYLIESLAGYQLEHVQSYVETLGNQIVFTAIAASVLEPTNIQVTVFDEVRYVVNERTEYACAGGGFMLQEEAVLEIDFPGFSQYSLAGRWSFQNCRIDTNAADLLSGEHVINGELFTVEEYKSGNRFSNLERAVTFAGFILEAPEYNSLRIDASATISSLDTYNPSSSRNVVINEYQAVRDGGVLRDIRDADFRFLSSDEGSGAIEIRSMYANGRILGSATQGMDITIKTVETFERTGVVNEDFSSNRVLFRGQMQLSSTDGSEMSITAKPVAPDFIAPLLYDYTLLTSEGDTIDGDSQSLPDFAIQRSGSIFYQR